MSGVPHIQISRNAFLFLRHSRGMVFRRVILTALRKHAFDTYVYVLYMNGNLVPKAFRSLTKDIILYNNYFVSFKFEIT